MKNLFTLLLLLTFSATTMISQVIVSTDPENKNVILEEFTGIHCGFCPDGHAIAQSIQDAHPDDVVLINIHTGGYAVPSGSEPDFRTPWGTAIAGQSNLVGYPAGTVNRHLFAGWSQGTGTAMSRNRWSQASNIVLGESSYLNVGLIATIVTSTRQLIVEVEVYYTDDSPEPTNYLNVAILQDDILGPQTGGGMGSNYNHMHMLRHLITGQWGVEISETTTGSLYSTTFSYDIPDDYTGVDVVLEDLDIVAFVTETHQELVSGNSAGDISFMTSNDYDAAIITASIPQTACADEITPVVNLKNYGVNNLTSLEIIYSVNNGEETTYSWTGNLSQLESEEVSLPTLFYTPTDNNNVSIRCELPNGQQDQLPMNDNFTKDFEGSQSYPTDCNMMILVMDNPGDVTWSITDEDGVVIAEDGPYTSVGFKIHPFSFPETGCYEFILNDASGEGLSDGRYMVGDEDTQILWEGEAFTYSTKAELAHGMIVDVDEVITADNISIQPNPVSNNTNIEFNLSNSSNVNIAVFDILGKNVMDLYKGEMNSGSHSIPMNVDKINQGIYFVKIKVNNEVITKKVMVSK